MSHTEQMSAGQAANHATIAAMADILAAIGSGGGVMGWADEQPPAPATAGRPVVASGVTIGHGPIRLRDSAPPVHSEDEAAAAAPLPESIGHGPIRLRDSAPPVRSEDEAVAAAPLPESIGHGPIRLRHTAAAPRPDVTPIAAADILAALDVSP